MSKLIQSFLTDALDRANTPEVKEALHTNLFTPLLSIVLEALAPYLVGIVVVWGLILLGIIAILFLLLRNPIVRIQ
jgi:hypothetical protein